MSFDPISPRQPLPTKGGFSPLADFAVWVLEQDGLRVSPFDKHRARTGKLQQFSFDAMKWLAWFQYLLNPVNAHVNPTAFWEGSDFYQEMRRLQERYWLRSQLSPKETYPLLFRLDTPFLLEDNGVFYREYVPGETSEDISPVPYRDVYVSRLKYRSDEHLRFDNLCAISEIKTDNAAIVRRVSKALGKGGICGLRYGFS